MVEQSASFHRTKYIKSYDNMAQIILPSKIDCMGTSNDIQYRLTDSMPKEVRNHVGISNEIQYHPLYFWGQFLSSLFGKS